MTIAEIPTINAEIAKAAEAYREAELLHNYYCSISTSEEVDRAAMKLDVLLANRSILLLHLFQAEIEEEL